MEKTMKITVLSQTNVLGPNGIKLKAGQVVALEDSPYVRILIKSGSVALVDPPSLDDEYLVAIGLKEAAPVAKEEVAVVVDVEVAIAPAPKAKEEPVKVEEKKEEPKLSEKLFTPKKAEKAPEPVEASEEEDVDEEV